MFMGRSWAYGIEKCTRPVDSRGTPMTGSVISRGEASRRWLGFPNPVNEKAARTVAAGVLLLAGLTLALSLTASPRWLWISVVLAAGFIARVLAGPRLSPLGRLATQMIAPRLGEPKLVAGPPKRFAQGHRRRDGVNRGGCRGAGPGAAR